ncbi:competence protein [Companilactobacillus mindensis DSM 14500]|uniref:Competence protein n=1 Tax=Companilactobacillus mindensis DSM 14500 TaxID=1423770 RepID=A0A0R1QLR0_9LACO|nr:competence protein CoiA family protein [Companilactobacillus mindensis]KRL43146.1 competence protein [Companilactobacillus mindensis DSM 14500]GEO78413.1 hypothetical protein LMI01_07440 [Companilactobacillus mindensis]
MYAALNKQGTLTNACNAIPTDVYFCSQCLKPVKLIVGSAKPFFRHENLKHNSVHERLIHQQGKAIIAQVLQSRWQVPVELEVFLADIQQRPDILVDNKIVFEYQCAKIDVKELAQRVRGYDNKQLANIWILGGNYLSEKLTSEHLKFLAYNAEWKYYLLLFDSQRIRLIIFHHIKFVGPFSKLTAQKKVFTRYNLIKIFDFKPIVKADKLSRINYRLLRKLRSKNDDRSQKIKMDFFQKHQLTIEEELKGRSFRSQPPIYRYPAWKMYASGEKIYLNQPLLKNKPHKKPPQM